MSSYKHLNENEINEAFERNPQEGALMLMADLNLKEADEISKGLRTHKVETHEDGWFLTFNTSGGIVGLWSCWLGDKLTLCFPKYVKIEDGDITNILGLQLSKDAYKCGQYCSDRIEGDKGRLWVSLKDFDSNAHYFSVITDDKNLEATYYGHDESNVIATTGWGSSFIKDKRDLPNEKPEIISQYRNDFIKLLMFIANKVGDIKSIGIEYQLPVYIPEELEAEGYTDIQWIKGSPVNRNGWGSELVYATKENERLMLKSANSLVPWVCYRQFDFKNFTFNDVLSLFTV